MRSPGGAYFPWLIVLLRLSALVRYFVLFHFGEVLVSGWHEQPCRMLNSERHGRTYRFRTLHDSQVALMRKHHRSRMCSFIRSADTRSKSGTLPNTAR